LNETFKHVEAECSSGWLACEHVFQGALAAGRKKEGEIATTSLEFEYLHRKSRCELMIGGDDISNDIYPWHEFVYKFALVSALH